MRTAGLGVSCLGLLISLGGCGGLPRPFQENPGSTALALAAPPPTRLAVPASSHTLLTPPAAGAFARDLATTLDDQEVPAEAIRPVKGDWRLIASATRAGASVTPHFTVLTPAGQVRGITDGQPVNAADWQAGNAELLRSVAASAAPDIAEMLTGIQAAVRQADPNSLMNRPARVRLTGVNGAPGDGDTALADALRVSLPQQGDVLERNGQSPPDYTVTGVVAVSTPKDGRQIVEIDWHVLDAHGHEAGKVSQLNAVPAHSLDGAWSDIATAAASEAAAGIHQVITNNSGRNDKPLPPPKQA